MKRALWRIKHTKKFVIGGACAVLSLVGIGIPVVTSADTGLTPLGVLPQLAIGQVLDGALASSTPVPFDVVLNLNNAQALTDAANAVSTPGSAEYHQYLKPGQFAQEFAPSTATVTSVRDWLTTQGFLVGALRDGYVIPVAGPASLVSSALHTTLDQVRLASGTMSFLNTVVPSLPSTISPAVASIIGLDARSRDHSQIALPKVGTAASSSLPHPQVAPGVGPQACGAAQGAGGYTQTQLSEIYGLTDLYNEGRFGDGQTIGLYELEPYSAADVSAFASCYGLSPNISVEYTDGQPTPPSDGSGDAEAALDIENAMAFAPDANLVVYEAPNNAVSPLDLYAAIANADQAQVVTTSWGVCEQEDSDPQGLESELFKQMALQGQTVVAAAGDAGSEDCYPDSSALAVDDPGSQPYVTDVGGTTLPNGSTAGESVWDATCGLLSLGCSPAAGGGGISSVWPMPTWQQVHGTVIGGSSGAPCGQLLGDCREVPDVTADADPGTGYSIYFNGAWHSPGGTSAGAPLWGAIFALINQGCSSGVGFANPALYAAGSRGTTAFNDVHVGNNDMLNAHGGQYPAQFGYDMASGWGSPNAAGLLSALQGFGSCNAPPDSGYWLVASDGGIFGYGTAPFYGSMGGHHLNSPIVGMAATSDAGGYWEVAADGGIFSFGDAHFFGSEGGKPLNQPIVGMASTPDGGGYWEVARDGGIFSFGDARFSGSTGNIRLNQPIVGMASSPQGGYYLVARDGGIFDFSGGAFYGSTGSIRLNEPIVGMAVTEDGNGYWMVAADGGIFTFGDAPYFGSQADTPIAAPIIGLMTTDGHGYYLVQSNGGVYSDGKAHYYGAANNLALKAPIVGSALA